MKSAWFLALSSIMLLSAAKAAEPSRQENSARIHTELAAEYYARAQYGVALEEIKAARDAVPDYAPTFNVEGLVYMDLREFDKAEQAFQRSLRLNPTDPDANHNYGWYLCNRRSKYAESQKYFVEAVKNPLYTTPQKSLQQAGICAHKGGDKAAAEDYLRQADRIQPNNPETLLGLARLVYERGDLAAVRTLLTREAKLGTPSAEALWLNVRIEHKLGNAEASAGFAKELRTRFPDSDEALRLAKGQFD